VQTEGRKQKGRKTKEKDAGGCDNKEIFSKQSAEDLQVEKNKEVFKKILRSGLRRKSASLPSHCGLSLTGVELGHKPDESQDTNLKPKALPHEVDDDKEQSGPCPHWHKQLE